MRNGEPSRDPDREGSREQDNLEKKVKSCLRTSVYDLESGAALNDLCP